MPEDFPTGKPSTIRVQRVDRLGPDDAHDSAIVAMRRNQLTSGRPLLAQNHNIPAVVFMGNNAAGPQEMIDALGQNECSWERLLSAELAGW